MTEYQAVAYRTFTEINGDPPWTCGYCGEDVLALTMGQGCVHHVDEDRSNNDPSNLIAMHTACHVRHHRKDKVGNRRGAKLTSAQVRRMSDRQKGRKLPWLHNDEVRRKIADSKRGKPHVEPKLTCSCGKMCNAGPMKRHLTASGHELVEVNPLRRYEPDQVGVIG